jgi:hypothetical protein
VEYKVVLVGVVELIKPWLCMLTLELGQVAVLQVFPTPMALAAVMLEVKVILVIPVVQIQAELDSPVMQVVRVMQVTLETRALVEIRETVEVQVTQVTQAKMVALGKEVVSGVLAEMAVREM